MLAREFENHSIENRRGQAPAFDMNMAFANPALAYPMSYGAANLGYHPGPGGAAPMNPYGAIMPPQSLYLPSSYTMNQNVSQVRQIPGGAGELHSAHLAKPESKNIDDEAYMFYDMSMQAAQTPRSVGDVNFGTDVDTLMRAIQIKSENRRRGATVSEAPEGSDRSLSNGPDSDIARDYNEPNQGFPRSRKKYQCNMPSCSKVFFQKTHLEIHIRAHTGAKPFVSSFDLCASPSERC